MEAATIIGLSRQMSLRRAMDITANNIANVNTAAYKGEAMLFEEQLHEISNAPRKTRNVSFVLDQGVARNMTQGGFDRTGGSLDFAINGEGFFLVQTDEGLRFTRDGRFSLNEIGQLVNRDGHVVLGEDEQPIEITDTTQALEVAPDGTISSAAGQVGRLAVVTFDNVNALKKTQAGLYETEEPYQQAENPDVRQGALEASNVQAVVEMTRMINIMRSYQSANKLVEDTSELTRRVIRKLGEEK